MKDDIGRLQARVAELQRCAVQGQEMAKEQMDRCIAAERENDSLRAKLERAKEALGDVDYALACLMAIVRGECSSLLDDLDGGEIPQEYCEAAREKTRAVLAELSADAPAQQTPSNGAPSIAAMQEAMKEAEKALGPLAEISTRIPSYVPDDAMVVLSNLAGGIIDTTRQLSVGALRRLPSALAKLRSVIK